MTTKPGHDPDAVATEAASAEWLFYDGTCGLCHQAVRWVVKREHARTGFRFAPIGGKAYEREVPGSLRVELPDSIVIKTASGAILTRSDALLFASRRMGATWRLVAATGRLVPSWILDLAYDAVAAIRRRLFAPPKGSCPAVPEPWLAHFHD